MKTFLLPLLLGVSALAQPIIRQGMTTNNPPQFQSLLPTTTGAMRLVGHQDGTGTILETVSEVYSNGVFFGDGSQLTNLNSTAVAVTVITNNTFLTFINTNFFTNLFTTNLFATNITAETIASTTIKVTGKATFNSITITNGIFSATNSWAGATNTLDMSIYEQVYSALTPCQITGFINFSNSLASQVFLQIFDAAATNITIVTPPALVMTYQGAYVNTVTVTNGTCGCLWVHYTPFPGGTSRTNAVFQQL